MAEGSLGPRACLAHDVSATDRLLLGGTASLHGWAGNLAEVRERTVLEKHLEHLFANFWALPFRHALVSMLRTGVRKLRPAGSEG